MKQPIIGLIRERNNGYLLKRAVEHAFEICDKVIIFDDCSNDIATKSVLKELGKNPNINFIYGITWNEGFREADETKHRQQLLDLARKLYGDDIWLYYFDTDECIVNPKMMRQYVQSHWSSVDGLLVRLFDAHATKDDCEPYKSQPLLNFRKWFCPDYRDILMLWKNKPDVNFIGIDKREPEVKGFVLRNGFCQHYGKALSEELWEAKCDYYAKHFSERYKTKWLARKGKYIHTESDFGKPLESWNILISKFY